MENLEPLINNIMSIPPFTLPSVVLRDGIYHIDINYKGANLVKFAPFLQDILLSYYHFITKLNYIKPEAKQDITINSHRGKAIYPRKNLISFTNENK